MAENDDAPVTRPSKATPLAPGEPVEVEAVTGRPVDEAPDNSTFGSRAKAASKAVKSDNAEDKSVASSRTRRK